MGYKRLFIFVEGEDDRKFFDKIILPKIQRKYNFVRTIRYATLKKEKIVNFLKSIKSMDAEYIFVADINSSPCVTDKKRTIENKFKNIDEQRIIVVIMEIESWYLAGLDDETSRKLGIHPYNATDNITKEQFNRLIPKRYGSRIDFMSEILKNFSIETAKQKNRSFKYFIEKYNCVFENDM